LWLGGPGIPLLQACVVGIFLELAIVNTSRGGVEVPANQTHTDQQPSNLSAPFLLDASSMLKEIMVLLYMRTAWLESMKLFR